ncbi:replication initiator protein A [uncultured Clostridium sp.]|uniref:replication initiator protein A n=1 Tax=uncultured Clostridium sp. TaxID=59620 RepID=UPI002624B3D8|nr:replication initiator protein A [uncultured Clostridium sp.]
MRLKAEDLERREFLQMPKWLYELKGLKSIDREIYMLGYNNWRLSEQNNWINEKGEIYFLLSLSSLEAATGETRKAIIASLKTLVEHGVFEAEKANGKATKYFLVEMSRKETSNLVINRAKSETRKRQKKETGVEIATGNTGVENHTGTSVEIATATSVEFDTLIRTNNNNNIIRTTTNINNIDYKEPEIEIETKDSSSSFLSENLKELKKYLMEHIQDIPTCKNIMFLVENRGLTLERIQTVVEYSKKNKKGNGYIYSALENNWDISEKKATVPSPVPTKKKQTLGEEELKDSLLPEEREYEELEFKTHNIIKKQPDLVKEFYKIRNLEQLKQFIDKNNIKVS